MCLLPWIVLARTENLKIELSESMFGENVEDVIARMNKLKSHGMRFSLEDFGTGYSSMTYLKRLPLDQIKNDRTFVSEILNDPISGAVAQAIISFGKAMGLSVIAEGVETEAQRAFLAKLGCHSFQGYLFSHPCPSANFTKPKPLRHCRRPPHRRQSRTSRRVKECQPS